MERDLYHSIKALNQDEPKIISTVVWISPHLAEKNVVNHNRKKNGSPRRVICVIDMHVGWT